MHKHLGREGVNTFSPEHLNETEDSHNTFLHGQKHDKLVAVLEVLNDYQQSRRSRPRLRLGRYPMLCLQHRRDNPRRDFVELLKRWLRVSVCNSDLEEQKVRQLANLTRDLLNYSELFPSYYQHNFIAAIASANRFLNMQLQVIVRSDKTCVQLAQQVLEYGKELLTSSIMFLLLGPTDLVQTDALKAMQVVALWETLPNSHAVPIHADKQNTSSMRSAWSTSCGSLIAAVLSSPCVIQLFSGQPANPETSEAAFQRGQFRSSGLAGPFREKRTEEFRARYLQCIRDVYSFAWLLSEIFPLFKRISDNLGDYGMICMSQALRPFLALLADKVMQVRANLEFASEYVDNEIVMPQSEGRKVSGPVPSARMSKRAFDAIERAVRKSGGESTCDRLTLTLGRLRDRSDPSRLNEVANEVTHDLAELQTKITSQEFRRVAGNGLGAQFADAIANVVDGTASTRSSKALLSPSVGRRGSITGPQRRRSFRTGSSSDSVRRANSNDQFNRRSPSPVPSGSPVLRTPPTSSLGSLSEGQPIRIKSTPAWV